MSSGLRVGLVASNVGRDCIDNVRIIPPALEQLGYSSVWFTDHVIGLKAYAPVYRGEWAESLTSMTWAASRTERIDIGLGVLVGPLRDPVYTAKVVATIDQLSGGRVQLGVGTGWAYREYEALGRAHLFEQRGKATNEAIEVMQRCWQGGTFGYDGTWTSFKEIEFAPTPVHGKVPLWIGGQTGAALRRAATWADVWHPARIKPDELRESGEKLDELAGRKVRRSIRLAVAPDTYEEILDDIPGYVEADCRDIVIEIKVDTTDEILSYAEKVAQRLSL